MARQGDGAEVGESSDGSARRWYQGLRSFMNNLLMVVQK
jgi:hypothetical protein